MESSKKNPGKKAVRPNEIPEKRETEHERLDYPHEREQEQQQSGSDGSYSEQIDVTPPKPHEFPSFGHAKTDFVSRKPGRATGRMIGYEPGTEGI
jgi:hypothetical protein